MRDRVTEMATVYLLGPKLESATGWKRAVAMVRERATAMERWMVVESEPVTVAMSGEAMALESVLE